MTRFIIVLVLATALISLASIEQIFIRNTYSKLKTDTEALYTTLNVPDATSPIDTQENRNKIDEIYKYWLRKERTLCLVARHIELANISDAIIYARNFIHFDNREEACAGLARLIYLIDAHKYNVGTSIQNVI